MIFGGIMFHQSFISKCSLFTLISSQLISASFAHTTARKVLAQRCGKFSFYNQETRKVDITEIRKIKLLTNDSDHDAKSYDVEILKLNSNGGWDKIDFATNCPDEGKRYSLCEYRAGVMFELELKPKRWSSESSEKVTSIELYFKDEVNDPRLYRFNKNCADLINQ